MNNIPAVVGGVLNLIIAFAHVIAMFVGETAFRLMDAEDLAELYVEGSMVPYVVTIIVTIFFLIFGLYGLSLGGVIRKLLFARAVCYGIGAIFILRGLFLFYFLYLFLFTSTDFLLLELFYSLLALIIGLLYLKAVANK